MYKKFKTIGKKTVAIVLGMTLAFCHAPMKQVEAAGTSRTAAQVVQDMTAGWNLGNSLDSYGSSYPATVSMETYWGNPRTSKALIDEVAKAGFNTVRIPVSWGQYTVGNDYQIQPFFMSRVKEVVDYCISNNMYVILNTHHDISSENTAGCFYYPNNRNKSKSEAYLKSVWTQVANTFKNYDDHLVFETLNEPRLVGTNDEWWFPLQSPSSQVKEAVSCINSYNQVALNAIRATGGNNATRCIMVPGYGASLDGASVSGFALPKDTASNRLILSIHAYTPYNFALADTDYTSSFTQSGKGDIDYLFNQLNSRYLSKGIPVVIGEMSATNRNNKADRIEWAKYYFGTAAKYSNVACCLWDNNVYNNPSGANGECHGYINRSTLQWNDYDLIQEIMRHVDGTKPGSASSNPQPTNPQPTNPQPSTTTIADGWYYLKNTNSQKYLTVSGNKASSGANVEISTGTGVAGQKWLVTNTSDGYITLTSGLGNFMLDVTRAANTDGANMEIYNAHSGTAQKFIVQTTKTANVYTIATRASNGTKNLDVYNHGKEDGTNVCQWTYYGNPNQQWIFEKINEASKPSDPQPSNPQPGNPQPSDPKPQNPSTAALTGSVAVNSWGSGYVANFKIENKGSRVDSWTLRIKKNDVSITSAWNVEYTESGEYYVITPVSWNSVIDNGGQVEFGFGGNGDPTGKLQFTIQ